MTEHKYHSLRTGSNPNKDGFAFYGIKELFQRLYWNLSKEGYFDESFGFKCINAGKIPGKVADVNFEIVLNIRKKNLWPIEECIDGYNEDDFFDIIEFLYIHVSKPIEGNYHGWNDCGMHWETFNKADGQKEFREKINKILELYINKYELSEKGEILTKPDAGFEKIFEADIPSSDKSITERIDSAIHQYRRYGSTIDERRQAVRNLADVLEYLRPKVQSILTKQDEKDLFNLANNFGIRHHNEKQKTNYDTALWLSWMFYYYLATIHVLLRKIGYEKINQ
ncbi:MAG: hypothetical protein WCW53_03170 [Syntrophales bacterium]|jgi:hypothetical protein